MNVSLLLVLSCFPCRAAPRVGDWLSLECSLPSFFSFRLEFFPGFGYFDSGGIYFFYFFVPLPAISESIRALLRIFLTSAQRGPVSFVFFSLLRFFFECLGVAPLRLRGVPHFSIVRGFSGSPLLFFCWASGDLLLVVSVVVYRSYGSCGLFLLLQMCSCGRLPFSLFPTTSSFFQLVFCSRVGSS